ncbi:MAG: HxlR family transcriptional regulator [Epulopiscium sp. Nuni2H_MBin003]|nr:MAG: HxlR family transcriptional regulator [Epulopiscium sp. Nuni2H_MBin003]
MSECKEEVCPCDKYCPLQNALKIIGGKWKIPILCVIANNDGARYSLLIKKVNGITDTMLSSTLKELEKCDMVTRVQYNQIPVKVEYFLTDKSRALVPILGQIAMWESNFRSPETNL